MTRVLMTGGSVFDPHSLAFSPADVVIERGQVVDVGTNLRELALMSEAGLGPAGALRAATINAARLLRADDELGSIEPGKRADIVVLRGDPFDFDGYPERVEQVWKDGIRV
jgi:imidazolonepropionase-like amidohydrolase